MININKLAKNIEKEGGRLYLVGGAVRDKILKREISDEDYCITGLEAEKIEKIFGNIKPKGKSFGVYHIDGKEFALARTEKKIGNGHKAFSVKTGRDIDIEEDLARRDITINAIAQDVLTNEIIDPFNGRDDIERKIIRATTEKFKEDPLRVYRVARFSAMFEFKIETKTLSYMQNLKSELTHLSGERVFLELKKALKTKKPSIFFNVLKDVNVLDVHFEEINNLIGALQPEKYHPEGDSYVHTMQVLDLVAKMTENEKIRFSALVHDLGKGITPKEEYPHHYGHDIKGVKLIGNLANRIKIPNTWRKCGKTACKEHMKGGIFNEMIPSKKVDFIERVDKTVLGLEGLEIVVRADKTRENLENMKECEFLEIGKKMLEEVDGKYIEKKYGNKYKGQEFKSILHQERVKWLKI